MEKRQCTDKAKPIRNRQRVAGMQRRKKVKEGTKSDDSLPERGESLKENTLKEVRGNDFTKLVAQVL